MYNILIHDLVDVYVRNVQAATPSLWLANGILRHLLFNLQMLQRSCTLMTSRLILLLNKLPRVSNPDIC